MSLTIDTCCTPSDYAEPRWDEHQRVHNWRNYISDEVQAMWPTLSLELRAALARQADACADREEWE